MRSSSAAVTADAAADADASALVVVAQAYRKRFDGELTLRRGDVLAVSRSVLAAHSAVPDADTRWLLGRNLRSGKRGFFSPLFVHSGDADASGSASATSTRRTRSRSRRSRSKAHARGTAEPGAVEADDKADDEADWSESYVVNAGGDATLDGSRTCVFDDGDVSPSRRSSTPETTSPPMRKMPSASAKRSSSDLVAALRVQSELVVRVFGIDRPSDEITLHMRELLENKLAEITLRLFSTMLMRNPNLRLDRSDVAFLLHRDETSVAQEKKRAKRRARRAQDEQAQAAIDGAAASADDDILPGARSPLLESDTDDDSEARHCQLRIAVPVRVPARPSSSTSATHSATFQIHAECDWRRVAVDGVCTRAFAAATAAGANQCGTRRI